MSSYVTSVLIIIPKKSLARMYERKASERAKKGKRKKKSVGMIHVCIYDPAEWLRITFRWHRNLFVIMGRNTKLCKFYFSASRCNLQRDLWGKFLWGTSRWKFIWFAVRFVIWNVMKWNVSELQGKGLEINVNKLYTCPCKLHGKICLDFTFKW